MANEISGPIFTSLSPNTEKDDISLALKLLFRPWRWKKGSAAEKLENRFEKYLGVKYAVSFNSGRSAEIAILNSLNLNENDEVLVQAFTCNAAINPILDIGVKPIFIDIDETLNLNPDDLEQKITFRSKVIMVQHTFGWPAQIEKILEISKKHNLILIEDCAHSLGAKSRGKFCGTFGEAAFFSFGRDKIISSVFGGMAVTNNEKIGERLKIFQQKLNTPSSFWIFQQLLHPILVNYLVLPAYGLNHYFGKIVLGLLQKLSLLSKAVYKEEKKGKIARHFPKKYPPALAILALNQFEKLEKLNAHRRNIAKIYEQNLIKKFKLPLADKKDDVSPTFLRYPILTKQNSDKILAIAKKRKIYLDDGWRKSPIVPPDTSLDKMRYSAGSCQQAEKIVNSIINLPTHINISEKKAQKIIHLLSEMITNPITYKSSFVHF